MDFFAEQRVRTRRSLLLYGLFLLIVLAHMMVALGVMALLLTIFTGGIYRWVLVLVIIWTLFSFVFGSFLEYRRLAAGGRAIAQRVGAVRLFIDNSHDAWEHSQGVAHQHEPVPPVRYTERHIAVRHERDFPPTYRRYYEIAEQLAIASGFRMPILYVLPHEQGINGFVAGRHNNDMVMVVTQGALDKLSDEALYGLIGHEYGHILHGDAAFNLQLMVVLAGLQLLYDWSDSINNFSSQSQSRHRHYFDAAVNKSLPLAQKEIDVKARNIEAQTAVFTTHSEWVQYWQSQNQFQMQHQALSTHSLSFLSFGNAERTPRNIWTLLIHGMSFSSMAGAQLIKHSFNRERELLADATSIQLTRSPAILETLKAIHQDPLGSRLSDTADINGLSHFFFASSGADLGDVSWFATHPSLSERISAINANAYEDFALQVAREKRLSQQKIREIYEQRRRGDWGEQSRHHRNKNNHHDDNTANDTDKGLVFIPDKDVIINGRLQIQTSVTNSPEPLLPLQPWLARASTELPTQSLITITDIQKVSLPQHILNHSHHPLGALALIEAVMLCHQGKPLSTTRSYSLTDIWCGITDGAADSNNSDNDNDNDNDEILPHIIDAQLLETIAGLDRRLDSGLIAMALKKLSQHDISLAAIEQSRQNSARSHRFQDQHSYQKRQKNRHMLLQYQQGLVTLLTNQQTKALIADIHIIDNDRVNLNTNHRHPQPKLLSLWQTLHLQSVLPILSTILQSTVDDITNGQKNTPYPDVIQQGLTTVIAPLDPSASIFANVDKSERSLLILFAYRLGQELGFNNPKLPFEKASSSNAQYPVADLRRYARLVNIEISAVSDANLQWLLLNARALNSSQLLSIIQAMSNDTSSLNPQASPTEVTNSPHKKAQIDYNTYKVWLSTLHTVMLYDTIISQDEHDSLTLLSQHWIGISALF